MRNPDFLTVNELAELTPFSAKSIYNQHSSGSGPLTGILTKLGGRLGCWRADYDEWKQSQRRLAPPASAAATAQPSAA